MSHAEDVSDALDFCRREARLLRGDPLPREPHPALLDAVALETAVSIENLIVMDLPGGRAQRLALAQCLVIEAIRRCYPT